MKAKLGTFFMGAVMLFVGSLSSNANAAIWNVVKDQSRISFAGTQTGNPFEGQFERFDATIEFDPDYPASARVHATISAASAVTGDSQRDGALPGKDWFNIVEFPSIVFKADGFQQTGPTEFVADGVLTVLGVDHDMSLPFQLEVVGDQAQMQAELTLNRQTLGVGSGPWAEGKWVGLEVGVQIEITAKRAGP